MYSPLTKKEHFALALLASLLLVGLLLPAIAQPEAYHQFADQRGWLGVPHFADVLSNFLFTAAGAIGLLRLSRAQTDTLPALWSLRAFFLGLLLTGAGSAYYHWAPTSQALFWDRLPMVIAFAGVIGTFLSQRVSARLGYIGLAWSLALGGAGLAVSVVTGNLALYLALQFGGLLGLLAGLVGMPDRNDPFPWWALVGWYALAKGLELGDRVVWVLTDQMVSGHTLKHLAAGMAGVAVLKLVLRAGPNTAAIEKPRLVGAV
jgi:hypothetical protein